MIFSILGFEPWHASTSTVFFRIYDNNHRKKETDLFQILGILWLANMGLSPFVNAQQAGICI